MNEHGTTSAYYKCRKRPEGSCESCRAAVAAYHRNYRAQNPEMRERDRWWNNTRSAAMERLVREYSDRFEQILSEERRGGPYAPPLTPPGP